MARMFKFDSSFNGAIRMFLARFRLPGEAQKIDRILEAFAEAFFEANEGTAGFSSASTAHILAFSVIMLNVDSHNPNIAKKNKMTKEQFIRNNRGIDDGKDLPKETLEAIFDDITKNEILTTVDRDDDGNLFSNPGKEGWMDKMGGHVGAGLLGQWRSRYFILSGGLLYYFKEQNDCDPIGFIMLNDVTAESATGSKAIAVTPGAVVAATSAGSGEAVSAEQQPWNTDTSNLSLHLVPARKAGQLESLTGSKRGSSIGSRGSLLDRLPPVDSAKAVRCAGMHVTFQGSSLGVSLRSRGPFQCPVVESAKSGLPLVKGDVLVAINGKKVIDLPNPMGTSITMIRDYLARERDAPMVLSFVSESTETLVRQQLPGAEGDAGGRSQTSAVVFQDAMGGSAAYLHITPTFGGKIKSVKYNAARHLGEISWPLHPTCTYSHQPLHLYPSFQSLGSTTVSAFA